MTIVKHGAVDDPWVVLGKVFEVLIVGGDDRPCLLLPELLEHRFGNGSSNLRFCASTELVDEDERALVGLSHHVLHVHQVRRIGAQIVLDALLIADVDHDMLERSRS